MAATSAKDIPSSQGLFIARFHKKGRGGTYLTGLPNQRFLVFGHGFRDGLLFEK